MTDEEQEKQAPPRPSPAAVARGLASGRARRAMAEARKAKLPGVALLNRPTLQVEVRYMLQAALRDLGMTQDELARRSKRKKQWISEILQGDARNLTIGSLAMLADAMGCRVRVSMELKGRAGE